MEYNVYCDESCHLESDQIPIMVLGCLWMPRSSVKSVGDALRELKEKHGLNRSTELKWRSVSPSKINFFQDAIDLFLNSPDLHFRCLVADKTILRHQDFDQDHDMWYYKMYFDLLKIILRPKDSYRIFLDIKDTRGGAKLRKLHEVLSNNAYDFDRDIVQGMQLVRSHEVQQIQLTDLLIGAVAYANRGLATSAAKLSILGRLREQIGYNLTSTTLPTEEKFNIFIWRGGGRREHGGNTRMAT